MIKALSITFFGWVIVICMTMASLQGCVQDECGSFPEVEFNSIENQVFHVRLDSQNNNYELLLLNRTREYSYAELGINLMLQTKEITYSDFGLSSMMACSPLPYSGEIKSLTIVSNNQYNDYAVGADLTDIFEIQEINYYRDFLKIPKYLADNQNIMLGEPYLLVITQPPTLDDIHQFTIQIELANGTLLKNTTEDILIIK